MLKMNSKTLNMNNKMLKVKVGLCNRGLGQYAFTNTIHE